MTEKFTKFDASDVLETDDDIAVYLNSAFETGNAAYIARAFGVVARAKGMTELAKAAPAAKAKKAA